jgi:hypothetical protein
VKASYLVARMPVDTCVKIRSDSFYADDLVVVLFDYN